MSRKKRNKKESEFGYFYTLSPGDPKLNADIFNSNTDVGNIPIGTPSGASVAEGLEKGDILNKIGRIDIEAGKDIDVDADDLHISVFWHSPSINLNWYPIVQIDYNDKILIHREGPENPWVWKDFVYDCIRDAEDKVLIESKKVGGSVSRRLNESSEQPFFRAFITNLGKYNEGELVGEWVDFPIDEDEFEEKLEEIGIGSTDEFGSPYEEWFVTDYDTNLPSFDWSMLGEYPNYESLQRYGEMIESAPDIEALTNAMEVTGNMEKAVEGLESGDIVFYSGFDSMADFAEYLIDECGGVEELGADNLETYFDYEALGRELNFETYETTDPETDEDIDVSAGEYWCGDENASDYDIGEAYVEQIGFEGISHPEYYFDYEAYGRDLSFEGYTLTSDGVIYYG